MASPALNQAYRLKETDGSAVTRASDGATGYRRLNNTSPPHLSNNEGNDPSWARWMPKASDHGLGRSFGLGTFDTYLDLYSSAGTVPPANVTMADLTHHAANDDGGGSTFTGANSAVTITIDSSRIYYMALGGFSTLTGPFDVWFPEPEPDFKAFSAGRATASGYAGGGAIPLEHGGIPALAGRATVQGSLQRLLLPTSPPVHMGRDTLATASAITRPEWHGTRLGSAAGAIRGPW